MLDFKLPKLDLALNADNLNPDLFGNSALEFDINKQKIDRFEGMSIKLERIENSQKLHKGGLEKFIKFIPLKKNINQLVLRFESTQSIKNLKITDPRNVAYTSSIG